MKSSEEKKFFISDAVEGENENVDKNSSVTIYIVNKNDTLWNLAKKYKTTVEELVQLNSIENPDSRTVYFAFSYSNTYLNVDGTFDMNHDNENKRYICSDDYEALYEECVGSRSNSYSINEIK